MDEIFWVRGLLVDVVATGEVPRDAQQRLAARHNNLLRAVHRWPRIAFARNTPAEKRNKRNSYRRVNGPGADAIIGAVIGIFPSFWRR